jgi:hypothetical protein
MDEQLELKGLLDTREEAIELRFKIIALKRKAQCREVNSNILERLMYAANMLADVDEEITKLLEN